LDDLMRYDNLWKFIVLGFIFYLVLGLYNWGKVALLSQEIRKLKK